MLRDHIGPIAPPRPKSRAKSPRGTAKFNLWRLQDAADAIADNAPPCLASSLFDAFMHAAAKGILRPFDIAKGDYLRELPNGVIDAGMADFLDWFTAEEINRWLAIYTLVPYRLPARKRR